jgi:hypothetical protein
MNMRACLALAMPAHAALRTLRSEPFIPALLLAPRGQAGQVAAAAAGRVPDRSAGGLSAGGDRVVCAGPGVVPLRPWCGWPVRLRRPAVTLPA